MGCGPSEPRKQLLHPPARPHLAEGRPSLGPTSHTMGLCVYISRRKSSRAPAPQRGCGWFGPGQGTLLTPASRAWTLLSPAPLVPGKRRPSPSPKAADSGLNHHALPWSGCRWGEWPGGGWAGWAWGGQGPSDHLPSGPVQAGGEAVSRIPQAGLVGPARPGEGPLEVSYALGTVGRVAQWSAPGPDPGSVLVCCQVLGRHPARLEPEGPLGAPVEVRVPPGLPRGSSSVSCANPSEQWPPLCAKMRAGL